MKVGFGVVRLSPRRLAAVLLLLQCGCVSVWLNPQKNRSRNRSRSHAARSLDDSGGSPRH